MSWIAPVTLYGTHVTLAPLSLDHHDALVEAVQDGGLWKLWYTTVPRPDQMSAEIERRLRLEREGSMVPFTVIDNESGRAVGMTTYTRLDSANRRLEIGWTWYRRQVQRTRVNTECKRLLLDYAFATLDCIAVELRTSFMNYASRRAIERLGAKLDGILRNHSILPNGVIRDMCVYSIIATEWPAVQANLDLYMEQHRNLS